MTQPKLRGRALGLPIPGTPGPLNAITDVPGVEVGMIELLSSRDPVLATRGIQVQTGVTAILPRGHDPVPRPVWAGQFSLNGNGEMTGAHWVHDAGYFLGPVCITNTHSVGVVHKAATKWIVDQYAEAFTGRHMFALPVVAETYDGVLNDINGFHVTEEHTLAALNSASGGAIAEGNVGGGNGMLTYDFKGGTGTSSRIINIGE